MRMGKRWRRRGIFEIWSRIWPCHDSMSWWRMTGRRWWEWECQPEWDRSSEQLTHHKSWCLDQSNEERRWTRSSSSPSGWSWGRWCSWLGEMNSRRRWRNQWSGSSLAGFGIALEHLDLSSTISAYRIMILAWCQSVTKWLKIQSTEAELLSQICSRQLKSIFDKLKSVFGDRDVRVRFRILLAYFQIIGSFQSVLSSSLPANYTTFLAITQTASLNFGTIFSPRCFDPDSNFYDELVVQTIVPILVGILILIIFILSSIINPLIHAKAKSDFISRIFLSCFIFFPSASTAVFQMFNCDDNFESGSSYLKADYRLECDGDEYAGYLGYTIFMIFVYPIGIPFFYLFCLWFHSKGILGQNEDENGFLHDSGLDSTVLSRLRNSNSVNRSSLTTFSNDIIKRREIERACADPVTSPYASLFGAYKPEFWYWECIECVRRLSLTGLLVFMYPGSEKQVLLAMLICFFWMIIYSIIQPHLELSHSFFMMSSQWGILLQLYAIYLIINESFRGASELVGVFGVLIGLAVFVLCVSSILKSVRTNLGQGKGSEHGIVAIEFMGRKDDMRWWIG